MSQQKIEKQHEAILKRLLALKENKRCVDCDTQVGVDYARGGLAGAASCCWSGSPAVSVVRWCKPVGRANWHPGARLLRGGWLAVVYAGADLRRSLGLQCLRLHSLQRPPVSRCMAQAWGGAVMWVSRVSQPPTLTPASRLFPGRSRTFGHRVKGVSMSTFKPEEITALQEGGNGVSSHGRCLQAASHAGRAAGCPAVPRTTAFLPAPLHLQRFAAYHLAKWQSGMLPKPVDRDTMRVLDWIQQVYVAKRFYGEPEGGYRAPRSSTAGSEGKEVVVKPLADVLGSDTPKLTVGGRTATLEQTASRASTSSATSAKPAGISGATPPQALNLLDISSPRGPSVAPSPLAMPATAKGAAWDPFGASSPQAASPAPSLASAAVAAATAPHVAWATFGDAAPSTQPAVPQQVAAPAVPAAAAAAALAAGGWEAFGDTPARCPVTAAASPAVLASNRAVPQAAVSPAAPPATSSPQPQPAKPAPRPEVPLVGALHLQGWAPVRAAELQPAVPLCCALCSIWALSDPLQDVFYPEFEQIRATGMLPTGQPVPRPLYYAAQQAVAPGYSAGQQPTYATYSYGGVNGGIPPQPAMYGYPPQQPQAAGSFSYPAAPPPSGPPYGGSGGVAGPRPGMLSIPTAPTGYAAPSPGSHYGAPSPAYSTASAYSPNGIISPAGSNLSGIGNANGNGAAFGGHASLRSSTSSLHDAAAGAPVAVKPAESYTDPFSSLAPGLRSALPAAAPPLPARPAPLPTTAPGSFYDLTAPAAPKPKASGNPFG